MNITEKEGRIIVSDFGTINLRETLFCGQAFRWTETAPSVFYGAAFGKEAFIEQPDADTLVFSGTDERAVREVWVPYLDLSRPYADIVKTISRDSLVASAVARYGIIHILNQEPWEALCSFIISACNNIPRIRGIVDRLCESFGERLENGYAFPSAEKIALLSPDDLAVIRSGYRAPYIIDAARRVASGEIDLEALRRMSEDEARKKLMTVNGVGKKVADCTMLFSLGFFDSYPVDRHIARANAEYYPEGLPDCFQGAKGLAQQYIFLGKITE